MKQQSSSTADSHSRDLVMNQFMVTAENSRIATSEMKITQIRCHQLPISISRISGLKMKTNGRIAVRSE